jgi:hypothetical protein
MLYSMDNNYEFIEIFLKFIVYYFT